MPAKSINKTSYLKDLALLFAIPAGVAIFVIIIVYTPKLLAIPRYDFIYSTCSSMECKYDFYVDSSGSVAQSEISSNYHEKQPTLGLLGTAVVISSINKKYFKQPVQPKQDTIRL